MCELVLKRAEELGALQYGEFTLSSGAKSAYYFDGRVLSLDSEGVALLANQLLSIVIQFEAGAIGGPTIGADAIVGATLGFASDAGVSITGFLVRSEAKDHGTQKQVEGPPLNSGTKVIVVDDVCSTGGSLFHVIELVEAAGCEVAAVFVVLDRHQGGSDELRRRGYEFITLLEADSEGNVRPAL